MSFTIITGIIIGVALIVGVGSRFIFNRHDHPVEEIAEKIIEFHTGKDIDLTPESPEKSSLDKPKEKVEVKKDVPKDEKGKK